MTKDKTAPERTARYVKRMKSEGYCRVYLWARKEHTEILRAFARKLRKGEK